MRGGVQVPLGRFPQRTQLLDRSGRLVREMVYLPLALDIPIAFNSCRKGPRSLGWRSDQPATLEWTEAQVPSCLDSSCLYYGIVCACVIKCCGPP